MQNYRNLWPASIFFLPIFCIFILAVHFPTSTKDNRWEKNGLFRIEKVPEQKFWEQNLVWQGAENLVGIGSGDENRYSFISKNNDAPNFCWLNILKTTDFQPDVRFQIEASHYAKPIIKSPFVLNLSKWGRLILYDVDGKIHWTREIGASRKTYPILKRGRIFTGNWLGKLSIIRFADGETLHMKQLSGTIEFPVALDERAIYTGTGNGFIYCIDQENTEILWMVPIGHRITSPIKQWKKYIFFAAADSNIYCLNKKDGHLFWKYRCDANLIHSPFVFEKINALIIPALDKYLYEIDISSGSLRKKIKIGRKPSTELAYLKPFFYLPVSGKQILAFTENLEFLSNLNLESECIFLQPIKDEVILGEEKGRILKIKYSGPYKAKQNPLVSTDIELSKEEFYSSDYSFQRYVSNEIKVHQAFFLQDPDLVLCLFSLKNIKNSGNNLGIFDLYKRILKPVPVVLQDDKFQKILPLTEKRGYLLLKVDKRHKLFFLDSKFNKISLLKSFKPAEIFDQWKLEFDIDNKPVLFISTNFHIYRVLMEQGFPFPFEIIPQKKYKSRHLNFINLSINKKSSDQFVALLREFTNRESIGYLAEYKDGFFNLPLGFRHKFKEIFYHTSDKIGFMSEQYPGLVYKLEKWKFEEDKRLFPEENSRLKKIMKLCRDDLNGFLLHWTMDGIDTIELLQDDLQCKKILYGGGPTSIYDIRSQDYALLLRTDASKGIILLKQKKWPEL
ncbi:PQQ-binding-like beta-propeller repeat protein [Candidatus Riflebacteria bacterium]